jgi:hypothetical protein
MRDPHPHFVRLLMHTDVRMPRGAGMRWSGGCTGMCECRGRRDALERLPRRRGDNLAVPAVPGSSASRSVPVPAFERRDCTLSALAKTPALTLSLEGEGLG